MFYKWYFWRNFLYKMCFYKKKIYVCYENVSKIYDSFFILGGISFSYILKNLMQQTLKSKIFSLNIPINFWHLAIILFSNNILCVKENNIAYKFIFLPLISVYVNMKIFCCIFVIQIEVKAFHHIFWVNETKM